MKRSISVLVIALSTIIVGCQNAPTDPAVSSATSVDGLSKALYSMARLPLNGTPREPYPNSGLVFDISGFVDYSMVRVSSNENLFNLHLAANARLKPRADNQAVLELFFSEDCLVEVSEEGVAFREVRYVFPERGDRLALFITFQITQGSVEVSDMLLDFIE